MDRRFCYIGAIPQDIDLLLTNKNAMISDGWVAQSVLGSATLFYGLACAPTSPATMTVNIAPGCVSSQQNIDNSAYGSLTSDTGHQIVKIGLNPGTLNFSCPAPATTGQSVVYLIEAAFSESDTGAAVLPYYNASNPASPWAGPSNTGVSQNTLRQNICSIQIKTGVAATTGTQVTPAPDVGYTGLWAVTVAHGATTITSGNIVQVSGAPFISESLTQKISQATADARYAQISQVQTDALDFALDTGTANALVAALSPAVTTLTQGMSIIITVANNNNGASTLNLNGLGAKNITYQGNALQGGELVAGQNAAFSYNGATWNLMSVSANQSHIYTGGTSTGSANAQVVTPVTPSGFSLIFSNIVTFTAGFTNTGAMTANIQSTGAITVKKKSSGGGLVDLAASDITSGQVYQIIYDGVYWELYSLSFPPSSTFFQVANNLSEGVPATMRANLGLGSAALLASSAVFQVANNFSEVASQSAAQTNLGLRIRLTAPTTFHVTSSGNDSTGNGTTGSPWLTIQHAVGVLQNSYDLAGFTATILWGGGTYTGATALSDLICGQTGHGSLVIDGGSSTFNCSTNAFYSGEGANYTIQNMTFTGNQALVTANMGVIAIGVGINFGACTGNHIYNSPGGGNVLVLNGYAISGGASSHILSIGGGSDVIYETAGTITLTGTPVFSAAFVTADSGAVVYFSQSPTFSGAATGIRYNATLNGVINTQGGGANYLPGSVAGSATTGLYA